MVISVPISWGELIDKITILEIKMDRIRDIKKRENINKELQALRIIFDQGCSEPEKIRKLKSELRKVNETLWHIEDDRRSYCSGNDHDESKARKYLDMVSNTNRERNSLIDQMVPFAEHIAQ